MLKLGVTGGIGSGKSLVCNIFTALGTPVYHADERAKILVNTHDEIRKTILKEFGETSFTGSHYNKQYMASIVFKDPKRLQILNSIIHPMVEEDFRKWCQKHNYYYVVHEAAILFESGAHKHMDYTLLIDAPVNLRIERVTKRDNISKQQVELRIANQWATDKIREMADWVIVNNGKSLILPQIMEIHNFLIKKDKSHG